MKTEVVNVTPEIAQKLLEKNTKNRPVKEKHVAFLASEMTRGKWILTGETNVIISKTNLLLDGQHTLLGIVRSGKTVPLFIAYDLEDEAYDYIDTGSSRSSSDLISVNGFKHPQIMSGAIRTVILLEKGIHNREKKYNNITNADILKFAVDNEAISDSTQFAHSVCAKNKLITASLVAALHFLFSKKNPDEADLFFEKFSSGTELKIGNPILTLRERLMQDSLNKTKLKGKEKMAFTIMSWNAFLKGKELKQLRASDTFPSIL